MSPAGTCTRKGKWFDQQAIDSDAQASLNYTVYRLADVLLLYAEASNRAESGPNANAHLYLNQIRKRANLPETTAAGLAEFEQAIWAEQYFELAYEGKMWFDMVRTRMVRNALSKDGKTSCATPRFTAKPSRPTNCCSPLRNARSITTSALRRTRSLIREV
jgi:hypothetical protein